MPRSAAVSPSAGSAVGRSLRRREDERLLRGAATFLDDLDPTGVLHVAFARSQTAHARVAGIDVARAREAPGVEAVVVASDLDTGPLVPPLDNVLAVATPRPLLGEDAVRFVGEPVAAICAASRYAAEDAAELVDLDLEPLPVVADLDAAAADEVVVDGYASNVIFDNRIQTGDVDAAFAHAAAVVERTFVNPRYAALPIESRGMQAAPEGDGVRIWASTQAPHKLAQVVSELLELPRELVVVVVPDVGGGFGQKAHAYPEDIVVVWLARRLGRPVRWAEDRSENLLASSHARDQTVRVRAAADRDGALLAIDADVLCDSGAYGVYPHGHMLEALGTPGMIPGPYRLRTYRSRGRAVATNKCPEGAYRGVGLPVASFVHERVMDLLAAELDLDPAEIRRRNLLAPDELPYETVTGQHYDSGDYAQALERALEAIGYREARAAQREARAQGRLVGLGIGCYVEFTGINSMVFTGRGMVGIAGFDGAHIMLDADGMVTVWTTLPAIGQGSETTFAQMAADEMGVDLARVRVAHADTSVGGLHGTGTFASRSAIAGGGAIRDACGELLQRLREDASERLEANPEDLVLADGAVHVAGSPAASVPLQELVEAASADRYRVSATFDPPAIAYPYATHACQVEVDAETGAIDIQRYVVVEDCGTVINPIIVEGQVHGAVAQGLGGTLLEGMVYGPDGQPLTASLMDYLVPTAPDVPPLEVAHMSIPAPGSPNGAKGVGEGGTLGPPGALANAVSDALGVECNELPLTPERVAAAAVARR
ncbi:MAG: xanthine dehydrogenase family protein molybdopterin-binding subunit [Solirubrobacteraceae bacterium]